MKNTSLTLILLLYLPSLWGQVDRAESLQNNVMAITAQTEQGGREYGFGFVTGERNGKLFIATAAHVVEVVQEYGGTITIKFYNDHNTYTGKLLRYNTQVDVALVEVDKPAGYSWIKDCLGVATTGDQVGFVGRENTWYIPRGSALGTIFRIGNDLIGVDINSVRVGTSGAPLINSSGIIGLIIIDDGSRAEAVRIEKVQDVLSEYAHFFSLEGAGLLESELKTDDLQAAYADLKAYKAAQQADEIPAYQKYLRDYPIGEFVEQAKNRIRELENAIRQQKEELDWEVAKIKNTAEAYDAYLRSYPNGRYRQAAQEQKDALKYVAASQPADQFILVKGGSFIMGCTSEQGEDCYDRESPAHKVTIPDFYLHQNEVTKEAYVSFLNAVEADIQISDTEVTYLGFSIFSFSGKSMVFYRNGRFQVNTGYESHPINQVSWYGAVLYCNWLSKQDKLEPYYRVVKQTAISFNEDANGYRLPSEAEWEYAARGGNVSLGYKFAGGNALKEVAWYNDNAEGDTHPVGLKKANELNLYDMSGNVWEWTNDCWNDSYNGAPVKGQPWGSGDCDRRVLRGGSWTTLQDLSRR